MLPFAVWRIPVGLWYRALSLSSDALFHYKSSQTNGRVEEKIVSTPPKKKNRAQNTENTWHPSKWTNKNTLNGHKEAQINAPTRKYIWNAIFFLYASWKFIHSISNISLSNMQSKTCKQIFHFPFQLYRSCCSLGEYWTELKCGVWLNRANRNQIKEMRGKNLLTNRRKKKTHAEMLSVFMQNCV